MTRDWDALADELRIYHGRSMGGTFHGGDFLILEAVPFEQIQVGDVVVFWRAEEDKTEGPEGLVIVHRVRKRQAGGLLTQGDANPGPDDGLLDESRLIGRVKAYERARHGGIVTHYRVWNGSLGLFWLALSRLHWTRILAWGWRILYLLLRPFYRLLRASRLVPHFWRPTVVYLRLQTPDGELLKVIVNGKTVAHRLPGARRMRCRKPYDLIIDESDLLNS
jgi:signal peptidase I